MATKKTYSRYTLELEWAFDRPDSLTDDAKFRGNSGILVHVGQKNALGVWPRSIEVQGMHKKAGLILPIPRNVKCERTFNKETLAKVLNPVGQWNAMRIEVDAGDMVISLNGTVISTVSDCELTEGPIGIQSEGVGTRWRNIRIREHDASAQWQPPDKTWQSLFNGEDFTGWKLPDAKHAWKVVDGVIDYEAKGGSIATEKSFKNYKLHVEWRLKRTAGPPYLAKLVDDNGNPLLDDKGVQITKAIPNADSGILLRGTRQSQTNIWCWPCGSGQFWSYRDHKDATIRNAAWPDKRADNPVGQWNAFDITVVDETVSVILNGETVMAATRLPGVGTEGPIALQHHGGYNKKKKTWHSASALIQFRNLWLKPLD